MLDALQVNVVAGPIKLGASSTFFPMSVVNHVPQEKAT